MKLILLGSGAVRPDLEHWGPAQVVQVAGQNLLFDCGRGATMRLVEAGIPIQSIKNVLEQTPPELSADIIDRGMVLSGGTALLRNIDRLITKATGVPAHVADEPIYCVAKGTGIALELISTGKRVFVFEKSIS